MTGIYKRLLWLIIVLSAYGAAAEGSELDSQREQAVAEILIAVESYASDRNSFVIEGGGAGGGSQGWIHFAPTSYSNSISGVLVELGLLTSPAPKDPLHATLGAYSPYDFLMYRCLDRVAVFSKVDSIQPDPAHSQWWDGNNCPRYPIDTLDHTYFKLSKSINDIDANNEFDDERKQAVANILTAVESYASQRNSYIVEGGGAGGGSQGWVHFAPPSYSNSISGALIELGLLDDPAPKDPLHNTLGSYSPYDFLMYRCLDRVAVFSKADSIQPDPIHSQWWEDKNCLRYPIDVLDHTYFKLSESINDIDRNNEFDSQREQAVTEILVAVESYASERNTFVIEGGGAGGGSQGWVHFAPPSYSNSISGALIDLDLLNSPAPKDPLHDTLGSYSPYDFLMYRCLDRVAVFSKADSIQPDPAHSQWWEDNNCLRYPIDVLDHTYFVLSESINDIDVNNEFDGQREQAVAETLSAVENYARNRNSFVIEGGGAGGGSQGWVHFAPPSYSNSISGVLIELGLLDAPAPKDPLHDTLGSYSPYDLLMYRCLDRVAVFSKADSIQPDPAHSQWWDDNNCPRHPIDGLDHTYFKLSEGLMSYQYTLVFEDNFNEPNLDPTKWDTSHLWGPYLVTNNEEQLYVDSLGMHADVTHSPFTLSGETLKITATPTSGSLAPPPRPASDSQLWQPNSYSEYNKNYTVGAPGDSNYNSGYKESEINYLSGIVTSYGSFNMTHGYVEMRAKLPAGRGLWPAFWLLPQHYVKDVPEIDVMEFLGQDVTTIYNTYHYFDVEDNWNLISTPSYPTLSEDWTTDFHTFGMAWTPTEIVWFIDGKETKAIDNLDYIIPNQPMYLLANLAVGGNWPGAPDSTTAFPADFEIDYIRAYKKNTSQTLDLANDYQIMFSDEFDGDSLDPSKWNTHFLWGPYLPINNEEQYYVDALGSDLGGSTPFSISDGILSITARNETDSLGFPIPETLPEVTDSIWTEFNTFDRNLSYSAPTYTSGIITSYDGFKFANGYAEIRAKIPKGDGLWPAFWLLNGYYVSQQPEIDVMEARGEKAAEIVHSYHYLDSDGVQQSESFNSTHSDQTLGYSGDFHTYGVRWQPGKIDWYIDSELKHSYADSNVGYQVMYVIANLAVGGDFKLLGTETDTTLFPVSLEIDYIRVYQENGIER